jgi:hypothetical protein
MDARPVSVYTLVEGPRETSAVPLHAEGVRPYVSHFTTCPNAGEWSGRTRRA